MMKQLEYPFDASYLLLHRRQIKKALSDEKIVLTEKKIAVLGGSTTKSILQMLEIFLLNQGIKPVFYESDYGRYYEEAVFPNERLEQFKPDIIYIHTTNRNVTAYPSMTDSREAVDRLLSSEIHKFRTIWDSLGRAYQCPIIQNNFEMPLYRLMGNKDASDIHGAVNFLSRLNMEFYQYAQAHDGFYICDINYISADYGLKEWSDPFYWHMYKYALNINAAPYLAFNVSNIVKSVFGKNKKGFVLDLDNTLWGGIIGEDGAENIRLGPEESGGQVYSEFQRYIKAHRQMGIVLNIASKNEKRNALEGLNHPASDLRRDDFAVIKANWEPKDRNLVQIAEELKLLPESLVFIDDNPAERYIVTEHLPGVSAPAIGEAHQYIQNIDRNGFFEVTVFSEEDQKRNEMYMENVERARLKERFTDYGEYLKSLEMKAVIRPFEPIYMSRIAQLTNKSNQFNLTTRRYTQAELESVAKEKSYITLYGKLEDRFGDNGIVSVIIGRVQDSTCHIELWLMSCRVLKRDMEYAMMDELACQCQTRGLTEIIGYYAPTAKNAMVKDLFKEMGFEMISEKEEHTVWLFRVTDLYQQKNQYIQMKGKQE